MSGRPLPVRVLRFAAWVTLALALIALGIGALLEFDGLAKIWAVIGGAMLVTSIAAFLGARPSRGGFVAAAIACTLLWFLPPIPIAIALLASQTWPQLREYYGLQRRPA